MCGISGWLNWSREPSIDVVRQMNDRLVHRGPDAGAVISRGPIVLAHRRLSIIDLSESANQPMKDATGQIWIVFNGEIYNYRELRADLEAKGSVFRTKSDTEVILECYREWGIECLKKLTGMFALAIWDQKKQRLLLARDRIGEKPLFYAEDGEGGLIFASELNALRAHPSVGSRLDMNALGQYLTLNYTLGESCLIAGVSKLLPAHYLLYERGKRPKRESYWDLSTHFCNKNRFSDERMASEQLSALIDDSTQLQTNADVPLGAFLSGGIDSSTIVSAMARVGLSGRVHTFSIGFHESGYSELAEARYVADHLEIEHGERMVDVEMLDELPRIVRSMDEPMADTSFIPMYFLAAFAKEKVSVALSGDGGDEILGGYETYVADILHQRTSWVPKSCVRLLESFITGVVPVSHEKVSMDYRLRRFLQGAEMDSDRAHYYWRTIFSDSEKAAILNPDVREEVMRNDPFNHFNELANKVRNCHYLDRGMYVDINTWLPDDILVKLDRASMAHSLECRAPFLDHRLVEFCAALPVRSKINGFRTKHLLKESQREYLPRRILNRRKRGFNAPVAHWFSGKFKDLLFEATTGGRMAGLFDVAKVGELWNRHGSRREDNGYKLFGLACMGLWLRQLDGDSPAHLDGIS